MDGVAAERTHTMAVTRDYISQPRLSKCAFWSQRLSFLASTTVMLCWQGCHTPPQTHYNESRTRQLVWCSTFVFVTT